MRRISRYAQSVILCICIFALVFVGHPVSKHSVAQSAPAGTFAETLVYRINLFRDANGKAPLKINAALTVAAEGHSTSMATQNFFSHRDPSANCNSPGMRATAAGYAWTNLLENLAAGQSTPDEAFAAFEESVAHRATMLSDLPREIGVGYVHDTEDNADVQVSHTGDCTFDATPAGPFDHYWTVVFGARTVADSRTPLLPAVIANEAIVVNARTVKLYVHRNSMPTQVRIFSEGCWSAWEDWQPEYTHRLPTGSGLKLLQTEIRSNSVTQIATDTVILEDPHEQLSPINNCGGVIVAHTLLLPLIVRK